MPQQFEIPGLKVVIADMDAATIKATALAEKLLSAAVAADKALAPYKDTTGLKNFNDLVVKSGEGQKKVATEADLYEKAIQRLNFAQSEAGKKIAAVNIEIQKQNNENKNLAKSTSDSATALEKFNAKILQSTKDAKNLGAALALMELEGKKNTAEYKKLEKEFEESAKTAKKLNDTYRDISKSAGDNRALVGSYSEELKGHFEKLSGGLHGISEAIAKGDIKGALGGIKTVVTGFATAIKDVNDSVVNSVTGFFNLSSATSATATATDAATVSMAANTVATDANAASADTGVVSVIGFQQAQAGAAASADAMAVSEEAAAGATTELAAANEAAALSAEQAGLSTDFQTESTVAATLANAELSVAQEGTMSANEVLAGTSLEAAAATEALAATQAEAAAAAEALAITSGAATAGAAGMAVAEGVATAASEGLAVGATTGAAAVGLLDVVLGILLAPVTLVIAAIGLLVYIFKDFAPIVNPIKDAFSALGAVFSVIKQDIFDLVTGARSLSEILDVFGSSCADAAKEAYDLGQAERDLAKAQDIQSVASAQATTKINELLLKGRDLSKSYAERNSYLNEAIGLEKKKSEAELKNNAEAIRIASIKLFEGKVLNDQEKKWIKEQDYAKIRSLKITKNLDKEELEEYAKLLKEKEQLKQAAISVEEKAQNRVNKNIQRDDQAQQKAKDEAANDAEKAAKEKLDNEKKTAEETIKVMKLTLDNLIDNYDQSGKLDEENVAHVEAISAMKIKIAEAERAKNLIGVKKGSVDEQIANEHLAQEIIKINSEKEKNLKAITKDRIQIEIELYDLYNKTLIDGSKNLTDQLVAEERKRLEETLKIQKERMRASLKIDEDTTDEKLRLYAKTGAKLTENELKYLQFIEKEESATNKQIQKNDSDLVQYKVKLIEMEEKANKNKFALSRKGSAADAAYAIQQADAKFKKERKIYEDEQKNLKKGTKAYEDNVDKIKDIDASAAANKQALDDLVAATKKANLEEGFKLATTVFGEESAVGKAIAIAQITMDTIKNASKAFNIAAVLAADPLTAALAPNAYLQGALIVANGAAQAAKAGGVEFAEGTNDAPYTGKAIVDEEGPELHFDKFGNLKSFGMNQGARMTNITKGDKIIPADISAIIRSTMLQSYGIKNHDSINYDEIGKQFGKHASSIVSAIKNKKQANFSLIVKKDVNSRVRFKGKNT